jgi:SAM-dependent methyltransferase
VIVSIPASAIVRHGKRRARRLIRVGRRRARRLIRVGRRRARRLIRVGRRRARRLVRGVVPSRSQWHLTVLGADRLLELRWAARIRRAPVLTPEQHAAAVADPGRRGAGIEVPVACALCGGARLQPLLHPHDRRRAKPRWDYHVVRCAGCGFLYRHPGIRPERLGDLYSSGRYAAFLAGKYTRKRIRRYELTMAPFGSLFASGDGRRLLDFGCGNGLFLDLAFERGFECYGVDLAADAIDAARRKPSGRRAYHGSPLDIPELAAGGFDVITMWSVMAHLAQPVEDLTMLRGLLADDGVLLVLTVNAGSLVLKRQLESWVGFTPNHLIFFSPDTLPLLLRRTGFGAIAATCSGPQPSSIRTARGGGGSKAWSCIPRRVPAGRDPGIGARRKLGVVTRRDQRGAAPGASRSRSRSAAVIHRVPAP